MLYGGLEYFRLESNRPQFGSERPESSLCTTQGAIAREIDEATEDSEVPGVPDLLPVLNSLHWLVVDSFITSEEEILTEDWRDEDQLGI